MHIRITTLAENSASWLGLLAEWGLSILVETDDIKILIDTGRSMVAAHNARFMDADIEGVDKILFSHGHEDHTGGLIDLLELRKRPVEIIAHPDVWASKYWRLENGSQYDYIGIPYAKELAESRGAIFKLTEKPVWLTDKIVTSGEIPMVTDYESIDVNACVKTDQNYATDPLQDDQSLFIKTDMGLMVVSGCAHRGIINTIKHAQALTECETVYAVIGGIHLIGADEKRIQKTIDEFKRLDIQQIGVSHCTGAFAGARMAHEFGDRFYFNQAGISKDFDL